MTSIQENNERLARDFVRYYAEGNIAEIESRLSEDFQLFLEKTDIVTGEQSTARITKANWIEEIKVSVSGISEKAMEIINIISNDEEVWIWTNISGIHTGTFDGWEASQTKLNYQGVYRIGILDGKIIAMTTLLDTLTRFMQLGAGVLRENDENKVKKYTEKLKKMGLI